MKNSPRGALNTIGYGGSEKLPKGTFVKGLVARMWCYWEVWEPLGGGA
jgi:hypothetical protein